MITKEYFSVISENTITEALNTVVEKEYPKAVGKEIIRQVLIFIVLVFFVFVTAVNTFTGDSTGERLLFGFLTIIALLILIVRFFQLKKNKQTPKSLIRNFHSMKKNKRPKV